MSQPVDVDVDGDLDVFRAAMGRFASGVVVVTTRDADGTPYGFTASSFCSVSLRPPLVLVCLAETATSYAAFSRASSCAISILGEHQTGVARRFATKSAEKFTGGAFVPLVGDNLAVRDALAAVGCEIRHRYTAGDHLVLIAEVRQAQLGTGPPMVYFGGDFRRLEV